MGKGRHNCKKKRTQKNQKSTTPAPAKNHNEHTRNHTRGKKIAIQLKGSKATQARIQKAKTHGAISRKEYST